MQREYVNSSMISSIGYDPSSGIVEVEFRSSCQVWQYYDVPESTYVSVRQADSLGIAFNASIKNNFRETRVG